MKLLFQYSLILSMLAGGAAATELPRFEEYHVQEKFRGKPAPVKLTSRSARAFRTRLRENASRGINFAGHYVAATWGCGSSCWSFAIIDARTGSVYFDQSLTCVTGYDPRIGSIYFDQGHFEGFIQFRKDSWLIIVAGSPNGEAPVGRYYYTWKTNRLLLIKKVLFNRA